MRDELQCEGVNGGLGWRKKGMDQKKRIQVNMGCWDVRIKLDKLKQILRTFKTK